MRIGLLSILLGAIPAMAGVINNPTAGVFDGGHTQTGVSNAYSGTAGTATLTGTACFGGFCPGEAAPGAGPSYNVADPLNMRLTSALLECNDGAGCGASVFVDFSFVATTTAQYQVNFDINGTGSSNLSLAFGGFVYNQNTAAYLNGNQTYVIPTPLNSTQSSVRAINDSFTLGTIDVNAGDQIYAGLTLFVPQMGLGRFISLPNSLDLTLVDTASVPEPATLGLMALGLAALVMGRKRL
ncbi:MAG: PEP-CTERM sorting domain-containing protein [Bryobacteraceae bacterium]